MVEQILDKNKAGSGSTGNRVSQDSSQGSFQGTQSLADQAAAAGRDVREKAADLMGASAEAIKGQASDLADTAKDLASQTGEKIKEKVNEQKGVGAEYVGNLAGTMRRAAKEFDSDLPLAATYIRKAAAQVESISDTVRRGNFDDLMHNAQSFARRHPTAFLGMSVLAGFGLMRFLKSSANGNDAGTSSNYKARDASLQNRHVSTSETQNRNTNSDRGYRDDFTK
jgi:ElaB/YqjD/DUF883 family membrane-anchored ribosome-binding protein